MTYSFSARSKANLLGVRHELVEVCYLALKNTPVDFMIIQGLRTRAEQENNVANGKSQTMESRHLTGHAIDFGAYVDGQYVNGDTPEEYKYYEIISLAFLNAANELKHPIIWGGSWKTFKDGGHIELDRRFYP